MPAVIAVIAAVRTAVVFFFMMLAPFAVQFLAALGFGVVTYVGLDLIINQVETQIETQMSRLPADLVQVFSYVGVDEAVTIVISFATAKLAYNGFNNGQQSRIQWSKPSANI